MLGRLTVDSQPDDLDYRKYVEQPTGSTGLRRMILGSVGLCSSHVLLLYFISAQVVDQTRIAVRPLKPVYPFTFVFTLTFLFCELPGCLFFRKEIKES